MTHPTENHEDTVSEHIHTGQMGLPLPQEISGEVCLEKYAKGGERDVPDVRKSVARTRASGESEDMRTL